MARVFAMKAPKAIFASAASLVVLASIAQAFARIVKTANAMKALIKRAIVRAMRAPVHRKSAFGLLTTLFAKCCVRCWSSVVLRAVLAISVCLVSLEPIALLVRFV